MAGEDLYWTKVAAIGQVAGALATFLAVAVSLFIAFHSGRPKARLKVGERLIVGGVDDGIRVLVFDVANAGDRPFHVSSLGWQTGRLRFGPKFLRRRFAMQMFGGTPFGSAPPFEVQPGARVAAYCLLENVLDHARTRKEEPMFTRDWPDGRRRKTTVWGNLQTADGHSIRVKAEAAFVEHVAASEISALTSTQSKT
jgi:hypothetical protein